MNINISTDNLTPDQFKELKNMYRKNANQQAQDGPKQVSGNAGTLDACFKCLVDGCDISRASASDNGANTALLNYIDDNMGMDLFISLMDQNGDGQVTYEEKNTFLSEFVKLDGNSGASSADVDQLIKNLTSDSVTVVEKNGNVTVKTTYNVDAKTGDTSLSLVVHIDENGNEIYRAQYAEVNGENKLTYEQNGNIITNNEYHDNGNPKYTSVENKTDNTLDETWYNDGGIKTQTRHTDGNQQTIETITYGEDGETKTGSTLVDNKNGTTTVGTYVNGVKTGETVTNTASGRKIAERTFDKSGRVQTETTDNTYTVYSYGSDGKSSKVYDKDDHTKLLAEYTFYGNTDNVKTKTVTDEETGNLITYNYDQNGNITSAVEVINNGTITYKYENGVKVSAEEKDSNGNIKATYTYENGKLHTKTTTNSDGDEITYTYAEDGKTITGAVRKDKSTGDTITYTYAEDGKTITGAVRKEKSTGDVITYTYKNGKKSTAERKNSKGETIATYAYDSQERIVSKKNHTGDKTYIRYFYDEKGNKTSKVYHNKAEYTAGKDPIATCAFDSKGRVVSKKNLTGSKTYIRYFYDEKGNKTSKVYHTKAEYTAGKDPIATCAFDSQGRIVSKKNLTGSKTYIRYFYDKDGNKTSKVYHTKAEYTANKTPIEECVFYPDGKTIKTKKVTDSDGDVITYSYDKNGKATKAVRKEKSSGDTITYTYKNGVKSSAVRKDSKGNTKATYTYSKGNLATKTTYKNGKADKTYTYDSKNKKWVLKK